MSTEVQNQKRTKSFVREAVILAIAGFAVKIIGVLYKIPLTNILGDGIGAFNAAYSIYAMLFMLSTSGLPVAVSKLVSASNEKGRGREAKRISLLATIVFGLVGFVFMLALVIFAPGISAWTEHSDSVIAMRAIAPALFFICVCASIRGYFQGLHNMFPTAISQFIEAFFKMAIGLAGVVFAESALSPEFTRHFTIISVSKNWEKYNAAAVIVTGSATTAINLNSCLSD